MNLILGGAYQGKLEYAQNHYKLAKEDICTCTESGHIDFGKPCIYRIEEYTLFCVRNGIHALTAFQNHAEVWRNSVLICCDIFCGVVPLGADMRAWREETGRLCIYLSREAEEVTRIFCGLPQRLK